MNSAALTQLVSACFGIVGSIFFAVGVMRQSIDAMAAVAGTYWDWNPHLPPALAQQKADYLFGGGLIVVAFVLQLASFFASSEVVLSQAQSKAAPWIAGVVTLALLGLLRMASTRLAKRFEAQVVEHLKRKLKVESAA